MSRITDSRKKRGLNASENHIEAGMGRGGGGQGQGRGKGGGNKPGSGPTGNCICPKCGHKVKHRPSERCIDQKCPECGAQMLRE